MRQIITLYNVVDTRTDMFHPVAVIDKKMAKYFVPAEAEEEEPEEE